MESIGTLAGGIAHDLNNVLTPILLSTSLLLEGERDPARLETLAAIEASATRGAEMVSHVLSFARGLDGRRAEVQVRPLVADVAKIVRDTFPKNIRFEQCLGPSLWPMEADATQIHQVLINLCVNARDAMPAGGRITVSADNVSVDDQAAALNLDAHAGPHVKLEISDTGSGIAPQIIHKIFDPFFTTKAIGKGTGLGLATSLVIVKSHGGFIEVQSESGVGTRFCVFLPAIAAGVAATPAAPHVVFHKGHGETILVIDDEALIRRIARRTLEACGYRVLAAADGFEGVAVYTAHQREIAVVITDMMMPVMDGLATIRALVRLNPAVRIIGASGLAEDRDLASVGGTNLTHFLTKPYTAASLLNTIHTVLTASADVAHAQG
jgi:CheY-like chemotaxis protein